MTANRTSGGPSAAFGLKASAAQVEQSKHEMASPTKGAALDWTFSIRHGPVSENPHRPRLTSFLLQLAGYQGVGGPHRLINAILKHGLLGMLAGLVSLARFYAIKLRGGYAKIGFPS
jgi:hypothetical protein